MQMLTPPPEVARVGLRGIKMVAMADGELHDLERGLIEAAQKHILKTDFDIDALEEITPAELAAGIPAPFQPRVLNACLIVGLIDGEASEAERSLMAEYAQAFGVKSQALKDFSRLTHDHLMLFRFDVVRRSFIGMRVKKHFKDKGVRGIAPIVAALRGKEHLATAERYRALETYPEGTLGRGYADFIRSSEFSFPGEVGGPPEPILFHDCLHVLGEYGTEALEETQIASFQAGMLSDDPIFAMFFMLAQFQLGVQVTPITDALEMVVEPDKMLSAFMRGTKVNRDLCADWDPWDDMDVPVVELRERYAIVPR